MASRIFFNDPNCKVCPKIKKAVALFNKGKPPREKIMIKNERAAEWSEEAVKRAYGGESSGFTGLLKFDGMDLTREGLKDLDWKRIYLLLEQLNG